MTIRTKCNLPILEQQMVGSNVSICVKKGYMWRNVWAAAVTSSKVESFNYMVHTLGRQGMARHWAPNRLWQQLATKPTMSNVCPVTDTKERLTEQTVRFWNEKREAKEKDQLTRENFKMNLRTNRMGWSGMDWSGSGQRNVRGSYKCGNEASGFLKWGNIPH